MKRSKTTTNLNPKSKTQSKSINWIKPLPSNQTLFAIFVILFVKTEKVKYNSQLLSVLMCF